MRRLLAGRPPLPAADPIRKVARLYVEPANLSKQGDLGEIAIEPIKYVRTELKALFDDWLHVRIVPIVLDKHEEVGRVFLVDLCVQRTVN